MKYRENVSVIESEKRKGFNAYILGSLSDPDIKLSNSQIFYLFTGKGGNHDFNMDDVENPNEYFSKKRDFDLGQYFTSPKSIETVYELFDVENNASVFDPTCGHGAFCNSIAHESNFFGVEYDYDVFRVGKHLFPEANIFNKSIVDFIPTQRFDYVLSNPPFNMRWEGMTSQFYIIKKLVDWLNPYGFACVFVPDTYLKDEMTYKKDIEFINRKLTHIGTIELPYSFKVYGLKYPVKVLFFQNKPASNENELFSNEIIDQDELKLRINSLKEIRKVNFYTVGNNVNINNYSFSKGDVNNPDALQFVLKKYLYEIKRTKPDRLSEAYTLVNRLNEERPYGMSDETWNAYKITPKRLISRIRHILSTKKKSVLNPKEIRVYDKNEILFNSIDVKKEVNEYFTDFSCKNSKGDVIKLLAHQLTDAILHSHKTNTILAHEQGTGKTVTSYAIAKYHNKKLNIIVAPAKVIVDVWIPFLKANNESFTHLKHRSDTNNLNKFILISYSTMRMSKKDIFKLLRKKINNKQTFFIADECHYLNNTDTWGYKISHCTFRKIRTKLLMSGTPILNSIEEYFALFSLLYNDTLINNAPTITIKKDGKEVEIANDKKGLPFGKKGKELFRKTFCPEKVTVFGNQKKTQDVYNLDELKNILNFTLTSVKFDDIVKNRYKIHTHTLISNTYEKQLYIKILEETQEMIKKYYESTGSTKKDAGLKLIRMINLLIDSVNLPDSFNEYEGRHLTNTKLSYIINEIKKRDELIVIGLTRVNAATFYFNKLKEEFNDREIFFISGKVPVDKRRSILDAHKASKNGVLICTQQSLSEGLNIGYVNEAYIAGLQWNMAKISQWYFRFIRIDQPTFTNINFLIYADSIEANLIKLLKTKDQIVNLSDEEYESKLDDSMIEFIFKKETDSKGKMSINWGENTIK